MTTLAPLPTLALCLGIATLVVWRVYKRVRRLVGRQPLSAVRPWLTVTLLPTAVAMMLLIPGIGTQTVAGLLSGVAVGATLAVWGLRLTRFEIVMQPPDRKQFFYTPNSYLGVAVSLLFVGRLLYRFAKLYLLSDTTAVGAQTVHFGDPDFMRSGWTLAMFGLMAGYYACYSAGLLRWRFARR